MFLELLRVGLWGGQRPGSDSKIHVSSDVDWNKVYQLAQEQSVQGVVLRGIEELRAKHLELSVPRVLLLQWIGEVQAIEQRNKDMNAFVAELFGQLREAGIDAVLVKGQGIAQCYERPLWRTPGDVDLLLNEENYKKGKAYLKEISKIEPEEYSINKEYITSVGGWCLELHGSLQSGLSASVNREVDEIQREICDKKYVRYLEMGGTAVPIPEENNDVLVIFTHYIKHFYKGGLGMRQICDWCRLLWMYRSTIDVVLLEKRLRAMGLMTEWKAFAAYAVRYLGLPAEAMPLYSANDKWAYKARKIHRFIVQVGNFGQNQDNSYFSKYPFLLRKTISMYKRVEVLVRHSRIFPWSTIRFAPHVLYTGLKSAAKGE